MILQKLKLKNFRIYRDETIIDLDAMTVIIGKNDVGKSTILEALEIFFNKKAVKIEQADANVDSGSNTVEITCVFSSLPEQLSIDARAETSLQAEYLLNQNGMFEVVKRYDCGLKAPKESVFARAVYPSTEGYSHLHMLKNAALKELYEDLMNPLEVDKRSNVQLRRAIWESAGDLSLILQLVSLEEEDGKKVWTKIKEVLPIFALFQADRPSKDDDSEVQDPMKLAISQAISEVSQQLDDIKEQVKQHATDVAIRTIEKLREIDPLLASELTPIFKSEPKWDSLFKLSLMDEKSIPINKRGSGTRRLILISFFRAEAERKKIQESKQNIIYAIEEPETSQHPSNQKLIVKTLQDLSSISGSQIIITTHVPGLAGLLPINSIRWIRFIDGTNQVSGITSDEDIANVADDLGILPDSRVQLLLCVEGPTDINFFENISKILHETDPNIPIVGLDSRIAAFPLGGSTLFQWITNHYTKNLGLPEVHIYDRDDQTPPKYESAVNMVNAQDDDSWATLTDKREMENYIHPDAIREILGINIIVGDMDDIPHKVSDEVNLDTTNPYSLLGENRAKRILMNDCAKKMTSTRISAIDTNNEISQWFQEINNRIT